MNAYITMMHLYSEIGDTKKIFKIFEEMKKEGLATTKAYNLVIALSGKKNEKKKEEKYIEEVKTNTPLNANTYVAMIKSNPEKTNVWALYEEMKSKKIVPIITRCI